MEPQRPAAAPRVWLVDGYNVLSVGLLAGRAREGWWTGPFRNELLGRAEAFEEEAAEIWVVFDGATPPDSGARAASAPCSRRAPTSGCSRGSASSDPAQVALVTADRRLAARARHRGVEVVAPAAFLARCRAFER